MGPAPALHVSQILTVKVLVYAWGKLYDWMFVEIVKLIKVLRPLLLVSRMVKARCASETNFTIFRWGCDHPSLSRCHWPPDLSVQTHSHQDKLSMQGTGSPWLYVSKSGLNVYCRVLSWAELRFCIMRKIFMTSTSTLRCLKPGDWWWVYAHAWRPESTQVLRQLSCARGCDKLPLRAKPIENITFKMTSI